MRAYVRGHRDARNKLQLFRCRNRAARKPDVAAREIRAKRFAFGLPQDLHMQLMFEPCAKGGSRLSAFRGAGFDIERRAAGAARRPRTRRKRLSRRRNLCACTRSCSRMFLKRFHRHGFPRQTKRYEAQNPAACLQFAATCQALAARLHLFARHSRVVSQCALSASTTAGFRPDQIPQSRFCRKRRSFTSRIHD
jgi:hypothetical protein